MKLRSTLLFILIIGFFARCHKVSLATVTTIPVASISPNGALSGGIITGEDITEKGVCWSVQPGPTIANFKTMDGSGPQRFESTVTGLQFNTTYYLRAYATNKAGTVYGNDVSFTTKFADFTKGSVTDIDGNSYPTIILNGREWMTSNLKTTHYQNGAAIPYLPNFFDWTETNDDAFSYYYNDPAIRSEYGLLYNFRAANDFKQIAPSGWHVPTNTEWQQLIDYLGGESAAAHKLRSTGNTYWISNASATNESGFTALPAGRRNGGEYEYINSDAFFWTYTGAASHGYCLNLNNTIAALQLTGFENGMSIRCVKN